MLGGGQGAEPRFSGKERHEWAIRREIGGGDSELPGSASTHQHVSTGGGGSPTGGAPTLQPLTSEPLLARGCPPPQPFTLYIKTRLNPL